MSKIGEMLLASFFLIVLYLMNYVGCFLGTVDDDLDFNHCKKRVKKRRKKEKGFWRKFLFLDVRKEIVTWHYVMFWINLVSFIVLFLAFNIYVTCDREKVGVVCIALLFIFEITSLITGSAYSSLYKRNETRSKRKYRGIRP